MKTVRANLVGRFGNNLFIWSHAKSFCEQNGYELRTQPWVGESIFQIDPAPRPDGTEDIVIDGYRQTQADLIYTHADCKRWFALRPEVADLLTPCPTPIACHLRRGDYIQSGYPVIGKRAYLRALAPVGEHAVTFVSDEFPSVRGVLPPEMAFMQDFFTLMTAPILYRGNSTFSFWASVLGNGMTYSPLIVGFPGGVEHDSVQFAPGNWPMCAHLPGVVTDLHLKEI